MRKILKRLQLKISPPWKRKQSTPRGTKSPTQNKPKEKHAATHINQANKDLEKLKNKHTETTELLKLKILQKESVQNI